MSLSDEITVIAIGVIFSYFIYKKSKIIGSLGWMCCGLALAAWNTGNTYVAIGVFIILASVFNMIMDFIKA